MTNYRIVVEEPPPIRAKAAPKPGLTSLLSQVAQNHPGQWVRITKGVKHTGYVFILKKKKFPNMEITTRRNADGTTGVWVRFPA